MVELNSATLKTPSVVPIIRGCVKFAREIKIKFIFEIEHNFKIKHLKGFN